jgi:hypothetical protein
MEAKRPVPGQSIGALANLDAPTSRDFTGCR